MPKTYRLICIAFHFCELSSYLAETPTLPVCMHDCGLLLHAVFARVGAGQHTPIQMRFRRSSSSSSAKRRKGQRKEVVEISQNEITTKVNECVGFVAETVGVMYVHNHTV